MSLARRRIDPSREFGRRSVSAVLAVSVRPRALAWRAARCSAPSRMSVMTISPHVPILVTSQPPPAARSRHKPPFTNARLISAGDGTRAGFGWRAHFLAPSHPFPTGRPALLCILFDGWLILRRRSTHPSCLAVRVARWGDRDKRCKHNSRRCRFVVCFNVLLQCDRSARRDPCRRPRRIVVVSFQMGVRVASLHH